MCIERGVQVDRPVRSFSFFDMIDIDVKSRTGANISDELIHQLIEESFVIWKQYGLDAPFLHYTLDEFRKVTKRAVVFVALDAKTGELLGTHSFKLDKMRKCVRGGLLAVSPKVRRSGLASKMLEEEVSRFREAGYRYMIETTATTAFWSVRWHLKNGYHIIGYSRSPQNNHPTYIFRKQIVPSVILDNQLFCRFHYSLSYVITRLCKHADGSFNLLGKFGNQFKRISKI